MLSKPREHWLELSNHLFETPRRDYRVFFIPHVLKEMRILQSEFASSSKRVILIDLISEMIIKEILSKEFRIRNTLNRGIHEASISQILKSHNSLPCIWLLGQFEVLINLISIFAFVQMEFLILSLAFFSAILNLLAFALSCQRLMRIAVLTFSITENYDRLVIKEEFLQF